MERINVLHLLDKLTVGESHLHGVTRLCGWWIPEFDKEGFNVSAVTLRGRDNAGDFLEGLGVVLTILDPPHHHTSPFHEPVDHRVEVITEGLGAGRARPDIGGAVDIPSGEPRPTSLAGRKRRSEAIEGRPA